MQKDLSGQERIPVQHTPTTSWWATVFSDSYPRTHAALYWAKAILNPANGNSGEVLYGVMVLIKMLLPRP